jgi:hypothetical protein
LTYSVVGLSGLRVALTIFSKSFNFCRISWF